MPRPTPRLSKKFVKADDSAAVAAEGNR